jgi:hypothetical protein
MAAVAAYLIAATGALAVTWFVGRGDVVSRDPSTNLGEIAGRHVSILGSLAAFAVTGIVLLVTLGRDLPEAAGTNFTTLLTLVLVAYMGFLATSILMANVADPEPRPTDGFDAPGVAFARGPDRDDRRTARRCRPVAGFRCDPQARHEGQRWRLRPATAIRIASVTFAARDPSHGEVRGRLVNHPEPEALI